MSTSSENPSDVEVRSGTQQVAAPAGVGDFAGDAPPENLQEAFRGYIGRVRGGEVGALPAVLGLVLLLVIFNQVSPFFLEVDNLANLPSQGAAFVLFAMGLIFVLLIGEIDLSAGTAGGTCAALMAVTLRDDGHVRDAVGGRIFAALLIAMALALAIAARAKLWPALIVIVAGIVIALTHVSSNQLVAIFFAVSVGVTIGLLTGALVAWVRIPSFVVTLALLLAWQGTVLLLIGQGGAISLAPYDTITGFINKNLSPVAGWLFVMGLIGIYFAYTAWRSVKRNKEGLAHEPIALVVARGLGLLLIGAAAVYLLNQPRGAGGIQGMPFIVPVLLILMVFWSIMLARTSFGRHIYAVGGNAEAARRAGIDVARIRLGCFAICSGMAALAAVALASRLGSLPSNLGAGNTLLYAIAAAVIGGTSLFGGRGKPRDALIGGLVIAIIPNGLGLRADLGTQYEFIITGVVLLIAASVDALTRLKTQSTER
jgi:D-xylose transport system permease protein